jgi:hypothetical protein
MDRACAYLSEIESIALANRGDDATNNPHQGSPWIFGGNDPTALDASLMVFLVRMKDVGRGELIPQGLRHMVEVVSQASEFKTVYAALDLSRESK